MTLRKTVEDREKGYVLRINAGSGSEVTTYEDKIITRGRRLL